MNSDRIIYRLTSGRMEKVAEPRNPESSNFVIVSHHGACDWSGFRSLDQCVGQFAQLENAGRDDHFYQVVER